LTHLQAADKLAGRESGKEIHRERQLLSRLPLRPEEHPVINVILWIVLGLVAGAVAKLLLPGRDPGGCIVTIVIGVLGALIGGFLFRVLVGGEPIDHLSWPGLGVAILGSILLLVIFRLLAGRRR
jgi:uncharacterized membrane protein YeaQ/YmgE (transglycosylase-associated protein family)